MACEIIEKPDVIEFTYRYEQVGGVQPPPLRSVVARNIHSGHVYLEGAGGGAPLGRGECLRLAEWLIRQARAMEEK